MNTRMVLSVIVAPLALAGIVLAASSTGLSLAIYILATAVCGLTYATLYLQKDLEIQLFSEIEDIRDHLDQFGQELNEQKEQLVVFKREVLLLDARQSDRLSTLEDQVQVLLSKRHAFWQFAAPAATAVVFAFLAYSMFSEPRTVRANTTAPLINHQSAVAVQEDNNIPALETAHLTCTSTISGICI